MKRLFLIAATVATVALPVSFVAVGLSATSAGAASPPACAKLSGNAFAGNQQDQQDSHRVRDGVGRRRRNHHLEPQWRDDGAQRVFQPCRYQQVYEG